MVLLLLASLAQSVQSANRVFIGEGRKNMNEAGARRQGNEGTRERESRVL
jgi:hypothetical protein